MDTDAVAAAGTAPLRTDLALLESATTQAELTGALGALQRTGAGGVVGFYVDNDAKEPDAVRRAPGAGRPGPAGRGVLPRRAVRRGARGLPPARRAHAAPRRAWPRTTGAADELAGRVVALETKLAAGHWDVVKDRDADLTYNALTLDRAGRAGAGLRLELWVLALGRARGLVRPARRARAVVRRGVRGAVASASRSADWQAWAAYHVISDRAPYLTDELVEANFDFYGRTLTGAQELRDRWKRGVSLVQGVLGEAVGKVYVARHFPPAHKARMEELVANLIEAYRESITAARLDEPGDARRRRSTSSTRSRPRSATPTSGATTRRWRSPADDLVGNVRRANAFEQDRELAKLGKPVDRDEWFMTPQTVNAYYNPGMNEIVFPAAILQPPFFDVEADDAVNYGGIGAVIGHEIGHGFDDQGSKYDGDGNLKDWWTDADRTEFETRTKTLIEQYDGFSPAQLPGRSTSTAR